MKYSNTAKESLESCKEMLEWFEANYTEIMAIDTHFNKNEILNKARRTIAKAEGR